jgi:serine/threonine-protein kinase HipA
VLTFTYADEALARFGLGVPLLSVSMPTRTRRYSGATPHAFFDGLLPEGEAREMIAYDFGIDGDDVLAMLGTLGRDCAGAPIILPAGESPNDEGRPDPVGEDEIAERLRRLGTYLLGVGGRVRASLAGLQRKLLLSRVGRGWGLPVDGAPSTHILKPPHHDGRFPHLIENEALCLRTAQHLGVPVARVEIGAFGDVPVLIVERYDRSSADEDGRVSRLHQEDFCQATAIGGTQTRKYEEGGGPSLRRCATTLSDWSPEPEQLEQLLDRVTLNVLVGNSDAHGKNLSLLLGAGGRVRLAPAYDVFSTTWYPHAGTVPGMLVNGVRDISAITRDDLVAEARGWGLSAETAAARVERLLEDGETAVVRAAGELACPDELVDSLLRRARALAGGLPYETVPQAVPRAIRP